VRFRCAASHAFAEGVGGQGGLDPRARAVWARSRFSTARTPFFCYDVNWSGNSRPRAHAHSVGFIGNSRPRTTFFAKGVNLILAEFIAPRTFAFMKCGLWSQQDSRCLAYALSVGFLQILDVRACTLLRWLGFGPKFSTNAHAFFFRSQTGPKF
jgi:hypothetical protein